MDEQPVIYRFGAFELDLARRSLRRADSGQTVSLTGKVFDALRYLVEHRGRLVEKHALLEAVWPGVVVEEANLAQTISVLRRALGEDPQAPRYVATISGRGYQFVADVEVGRWQPARHGRSKILFAAAAFLLSSIAILVLGWSVWVDDDDPLSNTVASQPEAVSSRSAIAVLPFDVLANDPEEEHVADGIAEDLITRLAAWRSFPVIARTSTFAYKGRAVDARQLGRELATGYLVEGSLRRTGNRLRISTQLIDASSGRHVWAQTYNRDLQDIFALQDEISEAIVGAMYPELVGFESRRLMAKPAENLDAWENAHRAWGHYLRLTPEENEQARVLFQRSVELDPSWSWSHAGLALTHYERAVNKWGESPAEDQAMLLRLAERAVQLDDTDPATHHALGHAYALTGRRDEMFAAFERGLELNPSDSIAHSCLGRNLAFAARSEEAVAHLEQAIRLSPKDPWTFLSLFGMSAAHLAQGRYELAIDWALRSVQWKPNPQAYRALAASYAHLGRRDEARAALDEMLRLQPKFALADLEAVFATADRGFVERVSVGLTMAGLASAPEQ